MNSLATPPHGANKGKIAAKNSVFLSTLYTLQEKFLVNLLNKHYLINDPEILFWNYGSRHGLNHLPYVMI